MNVKIIAGVLNGELIDTIFDTYLSTITCEDHFPLGEVYRYAEESPGNMAWRILQRKSVEGKTTVWYSQWLPIRGKDIPEIVRMIALMCG